MHRPVSERLTPAADDATTSALEHHLRTEAKALHEPADEARVQAVMQRLRTAQAGDTAPHPVLRHLGWASLAAACVAGAALLSLAWLDDATPPAPIASDQPSSPVADDVFTENWMPFQGPLHTGRTAELWTRFELETEWQNLRLDAARFAGPLALAREMTDLPATEPVTSTQ